MNIASLIAEVVNYIPEADRVLVANSMTRAYTLGRIDEVEASIYRMQQIREAVDCPDCHGKGGRTDNGVDFCNCEVPSLLQRQAG